MKEGQHPPYQEVLFVDTSTGFQFICGTTLQPKERAMFEGKEYPVCNVPISSASHPFFTGAKQFLDTEGRVDKFVKRYAKKAAPKEEEPPAPAKEQEKGKGKAKAKAVAKKKKP